MKSSISTLATGAISLLVGRSLRPVNSARSGGPCRSIQSRPLRADGHQVDLNFPSFSHSAIWAAALRMMLAVVRARQAAVGR